MQNIGIIGYGKMGIIRRGLFDDTPDCQVVAICDTAKPVNIDLPFSSDPMALINNPSIDSICICTPNFMIKDLVVNSLNAGKHVFAEKPPGVSVEEVSEMREALEQTPGLTLKFGFNHRYHDAVMEAKKRIDTEDFGKILWMRGRYGKSVGPDFSKSSRADKKLSGGGILLDQGIHMLDLFLHFCGGFNEVKSFCSKQYWNMDIEDNVFAMFRNEKGQTASLHSTMTQWRHLFSMEIFLERGYMVINGILSESGAYKHNGGEELTIALNRSEAPAAEHTEEERLNFKEDRSFEREIEEFTECCRTGSQPQFGSIDDAERLMKLIELTYNNDDVSSGKPEGTSETQMGVISCDRSEIPMKRDS